MSRKGVLVDVRVDDRLRIEVPVADGTEVVTIELEHKSGQMARLRVQANESVRIHLPKRRELPVTG